MDHNTWLGSLAEAKAVEHYTRNHWNVFAQVTGKAPCDLIIEKDGVVKRVTIKGCAYQTKTGSYQVELRSIRSNRTENKINKLDRSAFDELFIYIEPVDVVKTFPAVDLEDKNIYTYRHKQEDTVKATNSV